MQTALDLIHRFLDSLVGFAIKRPAAIVVFSVLLTALALFYTVNNFAIQTDTDEMIDSSLPFRQIYDEFNRTFPQFENSFIIVVDSRSPEAAEAAQENLYNRLSGSEDLYTNIYAPGLGEFYNQNGFLYLNLDELVALSDELASAQPVLAAVAEDQSLRGLFDVLTLVMEDILDGDTPPEKLPDVLASIHQSAIAASEGKTRPLSWQAIFTDEEDLKAAKRRLLIVQPVLDFTKLQSAKEALLAAREEARQVEAENPGTEIRFTGKMALNAEELKSVSEGALLSGIVSLILVSLVLGLGIRSARLVFAALLTLLMGLAWTGAFGLLAIGFLNIISVAFAVLFIGLGIDFAIHFILRYQEEAKTGITTDTALRKTAVTVGTPLALCAPTTALAFYAFVPTSYAGLAQLGLISGTGLFISFLTSLTLLPALLKLMPYQPKKLPENPHARKEANFIEHHGKTIAILGIGVGLLALVFMPRVGFDFDPVNLKDPKTESVKTFFDLMEDSETSPYAIQIMAETLEETETLASEIDGLETVDKIVTLEDYIPENQEEKLQVLDTTSLFLTPVFLNRGLMGRPTERENAEALTAFRDAVATLRAEKPDLEVTGVAGDLSDTLAPFARETESAENRRQVLEDNLFYWFPRLLDRLEAGLSATDITYQDLPPRITERYESENGKYRLEVFPAIKLDSSDDLERFVSQVSARADNATGSPVQIYNAGRIVKGSMAQATGTAAVVILVFLVIVIRRIRSVGLITTPVFLAAFLTAGVMVLFGFPFNFANVIVIPLLIGLGVDSGIHLVHRAGEEKKSAKLLTTSTPKAVLLSALTTLGSFGSLALSSHQGTASMGILLAIAIVMILLATLLVLPGLMVWLSNEGKTAKK